jgi:hypothetical protein
LQAPIKEARLKYLVNVEDCSEAAQEEVVGRDDIVAQLAALQRRVDKVMIFQGNGVAGCGLTGNGLSGCDDLDTDSIIFLVFLALIKRSFGKMI